MPNCIVLLARFNKFAIDEKYLTIRHHKHLLSPSPTTSCISYWSETLKDIFLDSPKGEACWCDMMYVYILVDRTYNLRRIESQCVEENSDRLCVQYSANRRLGLFRNQRRIWGVSFWVNVSIFMTYMLGLYIGMMQGWGLTIFWTSYLLCFRSATLIVRLSVQTFSTLQVCFTTATRRFQYLKNRWRRSKVVPIGRS